MKNTGNMIFYPGDNSYNTKPISNNNDIESFIHRLTFISTGYCVNIFYTIETPDQIHSQTIKCAEYFRYILMICFLPTC